MSASSDPFRSNLSVGLHAAAQPLAILRSWFDPIYNTEMSDDELREMVSSSTEHVDRLCTLFGYLQQLVGTENMELNLVSSEMVSILTDITEGVELWFENSEMKLVSDTSTAQDSVLIDNSKMKQAISTVLMVTQRLSSRGDRIDLTAKPSGNAIRVVVRNENAHLELLNSEAELGLAAAKTAALKQHCQFTYSLHPLTIKIDIPKATN